MKCKHNYMKEYSKAFNIDDEGEKVYIFYTCNECEQHFQRDTYKMISSEDISEEMFIQLA